MRNKGLLFLFFTLILLSGCNVPAANHNNSSLPENEPGFLWNLTTTDNYSLPPSQPENHTPSATATPQLYKAINFEEAFNNSSAVTEAAIPERISLPSGGSDAAQWLYFSPAEYSTGEIGTLYAAFINTGTSTWTNDYYLDFYAGANPSKKDEIPLDTTAAPGEQASFMIPIESRDADWNACWQLKNNSGETFYDFCYKHGNGTNSTAARSADTGKGGSEDTGVFWAFVKTDGSAPSRFSNSELSAEFVSSSPSDGHDFKAYDHYEDFSASFRNNGSQTWDSSYSLVFYSGYNWMHSNSFSLPGNVGPGETATITMPMEIFEDNDHWYTCWYLSAPDGKNLADFCFNYTTSS